MYMCICLYACAGQGYSFLSALGTLKTAQLQLQISIQLTPKDIPDSWHKNYSLVLKSGKFQKKLGHGLLSQGNKNLQCNLKADFLFGSENLDLFILKIDK